MEDWRRIVSFPGYSISSLGRVRNDRTGQILSLIRNQRGILYVGLCRGQEQFKRSVTVLVASAFLPRHVSEAFDTPINLDGDRGNNEVPNLVWRPHWFAVKYFRQFHEVPAGFNSPIEEIKTREWFKTSWDAATKYGLLDREILTATLNRTYVWPTYQRFRLIDTD